MKTTELKQSIDYKGRIHGPDLKKKKKNCEKQQNRTRDRIWRTTEFGNRNDLLLYTLLITCKYDSKYTSADKKYNL